eukprot:362942-Chlamydomonas_euryale.AAC.13
MEQRAAEAERRAADAERVAAGGGRSSSSGLAVGQAVSGKGGLQGDDGAAAVAALQAAVVAAREHACGLATDRDTWRLRALARGRNVAELQAAVAAMAEWTALVAPGGELRNTASVWSPECSGEGESSLDVVRSGGGGGGEGNAAVPRAACSSGGGGLPACEAVPRGKHDSGGGCGSSAGGPWGVFSEVSAVSAAGRDSAAAGRPDSECNMPRGPAAEGVSSGDGAAPGADAISTSSGGGATAAAGDDAYAAARPTSAPPFPPQQRGSAAPFATPPPSRLGTKAALACALPWSGEASAPRGGVASMRWCGALSPPWGGAPSPPCVPIGRTGRDRRPGALRHGALGNGSVPQHNIAAWSFGAQAGQPMSAPAAQPFSVPAAQPLVVPAAQPLGVPRVHKELGSPWCRPQAAPSALQKEHRGSGGPARTAPSTSWMAGGLRAGSAGGCAVYTAPGGTRVLRAADTAGLLFK